MYNSTMAVAHSPVGDADAVVDLTGSARPSLKGGVVTSLDDDAADQTTTPSADVSRIPEMLSSPQLVGCETELMQLDVALAAAREARGGAVFLVGEPGIGKSRLAAEAVGRASALGMWVLRGRGSTIGSTVEYRPITEALLSVCRAGDPLEDEDIGGYRPVLGTLVPDWSDASAPDEDSPIVLAEAMLRLTAKLGADSGSVIVLEDLHAADHKTLAVVEYLIDNVQSLPVVLVATIRGEPCAALDLAYSMAQRGLATVSELGRLDLAGTGRLVASCLGVAPEEVPEPTIGRLWVDGDGVPFVVQELLRELVDKRLLIKETGGWHEVADVGTEVPPALLHTISDRTKLLAEEGRTLLLAAAVLGKRFSLPVVQSMIDLDERTVIDHLRAAVAAHLVVADEPAPDWYAFRYPLTERALLAGLTPVDLADLSHRAVHAVESLHPDLPGDWCPLVASLRLSTGDTAGAATLFATAGRRALTDGSTDTAIALLRQAADVPHLDAAAHADIVESLLYALIETGQITSAVELATTLLDGAASCSPSRKAALYAQLAWGADLAGSRVNGMRYVESARGVLGPSPAEEHAAPLDAVAAVLDLSAPDGADLQAETLARRALRVADPARLLVPACQSWLVIGTVARERDVTESHSCFDKARQLAAENGLPIWGSHALARLGENLWLFEGDGTGLERARHEAARLGATAVCQLMDANLAMHAVLCGRFAEAERLVADCWSQSVGEGLATVARRLHLTTAVLAAHQGRRQEMDEALIDYRRRSGDAETSVSAGLAGAFCALLEEDRDRARRELTGPHGVEDHAMRGIAGQHGLRLLLDVMHGDAGWRQYDKISGSVLSRMRWNQQFVTLARAVLLGQSDQMTDASAAVAEAQRAAKIYPMARHLGLRLVADAANANKWGRPEKWLRLAEEHFHRAAVPAVASASRAMLRRTGVSVPQRRTDTDRVPPALRALGVTVREYEVLRLVAKRMGNKAIASRLYISPRTVEKHVANLVQKTSRQDREALNEYAAGMLAGPHGTADPWTGKNGARP